MLVRCLNALRLAKGIGSGWNQMRRIGSSAVSGMEKCWKVLQKQIDKAPDYEEHLVYNQRIAL